MLRNLLGNAWSDWTVGGGCTVAAAEEEASCGWEDVCTVRQCELEGGASQCEQDKKSVWNVRAEGLKAGRMAEGMREQ
jgi:hypothetical protein